MMRSVLLAACLRCSAVSVLLVAGTVAVAPRSAFAQDKKELSKARALFQRAIELEQAGNYTEALEHFRDVGQVRMTPQVRFHIASCEEKLGRLVTALGGYELALADAESVGEDFKNEVDTAVTRLRASIPKLVIQRGTGAEAAEIELDGVALGASSVGVPVPLDPGPHSVNAKAPGSLPFAQTVTIAENEQKSVGVELTPEAQPMTTGAAASIPQTVDLNPKPRPRLVPYVIGGVGVASLIGSGVLFALRQGALSDLENKCGPDRKACPSSARGEVDNLKLYNTAAQVALGVGVGRGGNRSDLDLVTKKAEHGAHEHGLRAYSERGRRVAWRVIERPLLSESIRRDAGRGLEPRILSPLWAVQVAWQLLSWTLRRAERRARRLAERPLKHELDWRLRGTAPGEQRLPGAGPANRLGARSARLERSARRLPGWAAGAVSCAAAAAIPATSMLFSTRAAMPGQQDDSAERKTRASVSAAAPRRTPARRRR